MTKLTVQAILFISFCLFFNSFLFAMPAPGNDACSSAAANSLTPGTTCTTTSGTLYLATNEGTKTSTCGTTYDVWYSFTTPSAFTSVSIDVTVGGGSNLNSGNTFIEGFSGAACSPVLTGSCTAMGTTLTLLGLTPSTTYYTRVFTTGNPTSTPSNKWDFNICITYTPVSSPPVNDDCANATLITTDSACVTGTSQLIAQTLSSATSDGGTITSACTAVNSQDVWYKFIAKTQYPTIRVSNLGSNWGTGLKIQLLSGSCGTFTEVACANNAPLTVTPPAAIIPGTIYYIRIHKNTTTVPGTTNWGFDICVTDALSKGSRMNEVFSRTILSNTSALNYPWEVTYGSDNNLWVTESRGYKVYKINPVTGVKTTVLDISSGSTFLPSPADTLNAVSMGTWSPWPQGGLAGLALHPKFLDGSGNDYVYVSYVHRFLGGTSPSGLFYRNKLVRFTYNSGTDKLESPVVLCDTLPGSKDHNSQRMIIAPVSVGGTNYLFYASGDMGSGQFENRTRAQNAQLPASYEGKILRFNLVSDGDAGAGAWIPNDNPYNTLLGVQSAVYNIGIRNNQGFAYDTALNILYGSSHGPYSDDEINIIENFKNYGHPLVIGYVADGNYNGNPVQGTSTSISAGSPWTTSSGISTCPPVGNEATNRTAIDASGNGLYKDPLFSAYPGPVSGSTSVPYIWANNPSNSTWPSEGWSGLDLYTNKLIPGWKKSLIAAGLKWGRLIKLKLGTNGTSIAQIGGQDTITYFQSINRYRDLAFAPNGKDFYLIMDNSSATSGPGVGNPTVPACPGCLLKYTFLGYEDVAGLSSIPKLIDVTDGTLNTCNTGTTVTIDGSNNFLWVPITGSDGNIMAEINANGNTLGTVTSSFYKKASGAIRNANGLHYLDRNITITPQFQPTLPAGSPSVKIRLYISKTEFDDLDNDPLSGLTGTGNIGLLKILKNTDPCSAAISSATTLITPTNIQVADLTQGSSGYVLQGNIPSFSSFYFGTTSAPLPLDLITFTGSLQSNFTTLLKWKTENEINFSYFSVERSADGRNFSAIGKVAANGNIYSSGGNNYQFIDENTINQSSLFLLYRLKIVDINGQYKYSNVVQISLPDITQLLKVSPNPATHELKAVLSVSKQSNLTLQVIDITGQVIIQKSVWVVKGRNEIPVNISTLANGAYYLNITGNGVRQKVKFQKL